MVLPKIIYQDEHILALEKVAGLIVDTSSTVKEQTLEKILKSEFRINLRRGGIVHRLDKDTSGIILVAKTLQSLEMLQNQFQQRKIKKEYLALVHGLITDKGRVDAAIVRNPLKREKFTVSFEGKKAQTEYEPISNLKFSISNFQSIFNDLNKIQVRKLERMNYNQFTLIKCFPKTGRTHQIRVHLKYIGNPVVADEKYCGRKVYRLDKVWCPRQFLHASKIGFYHPVLGWMELDCKLAEDLKVALDKLESYE